MRTVYIVTQPDQPPIVYGSVAALLEDPGNPIQVSRTYFTRLQKTGYPIRHSGCEVVRAQFVSAGDARSRETQSRIL